MEIDKTVNWIDWHGGVRPVDPATMIHYRLRNGQVGECKAGVIRWDHSRPESIQHTRDIIAFSPTNTVLSSLPNYAGSPMAGVAAELVAAEMVRHMLTLARPQLKVKKLHPDAIIPTYATDGSGCFDLHAVGTNIEPLFHPTVFQTGLAFEVPKNHVMLIFSRSGHGFNHDVRLANCVGVIDSDYRGEVQVKLTPDLIKTGHMTVRPGDRIAQALIVQAPQYDLVVTDELSDTERGEGGFGSTGV